MFLKVMNLEIYRKSLYLYNIIENWTSYNITERCSDTVNIQLQYICKKSNSSWNLSWK